MKNTKLILSIISMVLFVIIALQSCAAGFSNALEDNGELGGTAGIILGICMVVAAIVGMVTRKGGKGGAFTAGGFYLVGAIIGYVNAGSYADLKVWATVSLAFGIVFIVGTILSAKKNG